MTSYAFDQGASSMAKGAKPHKSFVGEGMRAAKKAGHIGNSFRSSQGRSRSRFGRGRRAAASILLRSDARRVVMKARVVRHQGTRFRSAPLPKHIAYLKREGVTRERENARMFDAATDTADERAFAERCEEDRHDLLHRVAGGGDANGPAYVYTRANDQRRDQPRKEAGLDRFRSLEY